MINITKCKTRRLVLMFQELLNLEGFLGFTEATEKEK